MALSDLVARVVGFLRAGYPVGVPATGYVPLFALMRRRLSEDEVLSVARELASSARLPVDATDIRVAITKLTNEAPSQTDTERVKQRLVAGGWPVSDQFDAPS
jgi:hypothetical protein